MAQPFRIVAKNLGFGTCFPLFRKARSTLIKYMAIGKLLKPMCFYFLTCGEAILMELPQRDVMGIKWVDVYNPHRAVNVWWIIHS